MLVSSYGMYIDNTSTQRTQNEKKEGSKKVAQTFLLKPSQVPNKAISLHNNPPVNYISKYKILNNRQELQKKELSNNSAKMKFDKISSMSSAKVAYGENSKMFSLLIKPKPTLNQTPKPVQKNQESVMKTIMVNTYLANENYYKITA